MSNVDEKILSMKQLENRIFKYDSSEFDKRFFRNGIAEFAKGNTKGESFTQFLFNLVWERNGGGLTLKYCYFNEHIQRVYLDRNFFSWCRKTIDAINEKLPLLK